jgi:hypothetical protein
MTHFGSRMRLLLLCCFPMNLGAALTFVPQLPQGRELLGLPEAPPYYLWIFAAWIALFGVCYLWVGLTGVADRTFLAVAAGCKAVFAGMLMALAALGELPPAAFPAGLPDAILACVFVGWLVRFRPPQKLSPSALPAAGNTG